MVSFLTLHGVFIPHGSTITLLDPATESIVQNHSLPLALNQSPFLLQSEFTVQVEFNSITYFFRPTAIDTNLIFSYLTLEDLTLIHYFLHPYLNPSYQIYFSLAKGLSFTCFLIIFLTIKLLRQKTQKGYKNKKCSIHTQIQNTLI